MTPPPPPADPSRPPAIPAPTIPAPTERLALALRDLFRGFRRHGPGDDRDKAAVVLLSHLREMGPTRAGDLAERAGLDPSTVSRHLRALEDSGHLVRSRDPEDGRATVLTVTGAGQQLVDDYRNHRMAVVERALAGWTDEDVATLTRLVRRFADDLETS